MNERREKMTGIRKVIAENMRVSAQIPQAFGALRIDLTNLLASAEALKAAGTGVSMTSFLLAALGQVLREAPELNSRFEGDEIIYYDEVHAGVGVATDAGLMVLVVRGIDRKDLFAIDADFKELLHRMRIKKLRMEDVSGSTVTVSNLSKEKLQIFNTEAELFSKPSGPQTITISPHCIKLSYKTDLIQDLFLCKIARVKNIITGLQHFQHFRTHQSVSI